MKKRFIVKQQTQVFSKQETSTGAYWDYVERGNKRSFDGELLENPKANPDMLSEVQAMYALTPQQKQTKQRVWEMLKRVPQVLTENQIKIFNLVEKGLSLRSIARRLGKDESTVRESWTSVQKKLAREYERTA